MKQNLLLIIISFSLNISTIMAQLPATHDTDADPSKFQSDAYILYHQQQLDSLLKIRLLDDLQNASGNNKKTRDLERKLRQMEQEDSLRKLELVSKLESIKQNAKGAPVAPFNDTLFSIYSRIASYTPASRAENIAKNILKIYNDPFYKPDSLKLIQTENGTEIVYNGDFVVMLVAKIDAMYYNKNDRQLATEYLVLIRSSIEEERIANSTTNLLLRIGKVLLIIAGLGLLIFLINRLFRIVRHFISANREKYLKGLTIHKVKLFSPEHLELFIIRLSGLIRILFILVVVYLSLPLLFSLFPETKMWTTTLLNWIISPARKALNGVIDFLPNLFSILVIYVIFRYTIKGIRYFVVQIEKEEILIGGFHADWAQPTFRILKFLLYAFMLVLIFPYLPGSSSPAFQGVSVFLGVLLSLGSSSAIANMVAGLVITYMRPFKIGDRVKIGDITGDVVEKTMLVTRIRTVKNEDITVPNSTVLLSSTTNYSTNSGMPEGGLIIHTTVTIGYDAPWKDVHQALIDAALRTDLIQKTPLPFVLQTSLDDFYVSYQINGYTKEANNQAWVYSHLHQNIQDSFNEAGIEIMSPHYRSLRDGNMTTTPSTHLGKDYKAPAFRITALKNSK